jgi:tetratricopeptide (TPR) repeat protein
MRSRTAIGVCFVLYFLCFTAASVTFGSDAGKGDYSKEPFIVEKSVARTVFENDGTWTRDTEAVVRMQSEAGVQRFGLLVFGYGSSNDTMEIHFVRVRKADGTIVSTPAENIQDLASDISRQAPMYSDYREKHVAVKGLGVGDTLEFAVRVTESKPIIPDQFWAEYTFTKSDITLDEEVEISVPKDRKINLKSPELKPEISETNGRRWYLWKTAYLQRPAEETPVKSAKDAAMPSIQVSSFRNWNEVARWWGALEEQQVQPSPEISAKAAELTKKANTDAEKLRVIYNYVATHFRYISLSFGIGRYQPHPAEEVLRNEYGDCKDKSTLLEALLRASGINVYPALINSTRKLDPDVPSPAQFDHVITVAPQGRGVELVWLDTTTEVSPFGFLLINLRDKQTLVVAENKPTTPATTELINRWRESPIVRTPANPPFKSSVAFEIDAKLDDKSTLTGKVQRSTRGDLEVVLRSAFRQTPQTQWKDLVQQISYSSGFGGSVSDVTVSAPEETQNPFHFSYNYKREEYPDWANKRISVPSPLQGIPLPAEDKSTSADPIEFGGPLEISCAARVEVPPGYTAELRGPADINSDFAEFHARYGFGNDIFTVNYQLVFKAREIPGSRMPEYREFVKKVNEKLEGFTGFHKTDGEAAAGGTVGPEDVVQQAYADMRGGDLNHARGLLEDAVKADAKNKNAWIALGQVNFALRQPDLGLAAFRKAIDADPADTRAYKLLAESYVILKRDDDAIAASKSVLKMDPNCFECHIWLGDVWLKKNQFSEAISEYEAAGNLNLYHAGVRFGLGRAYLGMGNADKALVAFQQATDLDPSSEMLNNIAWYLADAGQKLPEALEFAQRAVDMEEDDSSNVHLDELHGTHVRRVNSLAHDWDTLGWVYFRQGDLNRASKYVYAAWYLGQTPAVGGHLAQIYEKQGKKDEAIRVCAMAVAAKEQETETSQYFAKLVPEEARRERLIRRGADELSQMRHYRFTRGAGQATGSAEFFVLLAPSAKVEEVKFISGEEGLKPMAEKIQEIQFTALLPDGSKAKLVRRGILMCTGTECDFVLIPPASVFSTK